MITTALSAQVFWLSTALKARYTCSSFKPHHLLISFCVGSFCLAEFSITQVCLSRDDTWPLKLMFCRSMTHLKKNMELIATVNGEKNITNNIKLDFSVYNFTWFAVTVNVSTTLHAEHIDTMIWNCKTDWISEFKGLIMRFWNIITLILSFYSFWGDRNNSDGMTEGHVEWLAGVRRD